MSERIAKAAIRCGGDVFDVPQPGRHHDVIRVMSERGYRPGDMHDQGFVTSDGRFVDRMEGWRIAEGAGQIKSHVGPANMLFSEDVW